MPENERRQLRCRYFTYYTLLQKGKQFGETIVNSIQNNIESVKTGNPNSEQLKKDI